MHVLVPVFFHAPLGGLQANVRATAVALRRGGHRCTVLCRPGPFAEDLRQLGVGVVETDWADVAHDAARALEQGPFDLVHAHPSQARRVGLSVARQLDVPLCLTLHGQRLDQLADYQADVALVLCVSAAVRDHVLGATDLPPERVVVLPNGVDTNRFAPADIAWSDLVAEIPRLAGLARGREDRLILVVSRMDEDKRFIWEVVTECWQPEAPQDWTWIVAGDGSARADLEARAAPLGPAAVFVGWLAEAAVARLTNVADVCIAPGRSALEALACDTPTVAIGSKAYVGPVVGADVLRGLHANFGGMGRGGADYVPGTLRRDLEALLADPAVTQFQTRTAGALVRQLHHQPTLDATLLALYEALLASARPPQPRALPSFGDVQLASPWVADERLRATLRVRDGALEIACDVKANEKLYVATDGLRFDVVPPRSAQLAVTPYGRYRIELLAEVAPSAAVQLWVIEYDAEARLKHRSTAVATGPVTLGFVAGDTSDRLRLALRFTGAGEVRVTTPRLLEL